MIYLKWRSKVKMTRILFGTDPFFRPHFFTWAGMYLLVLPCLYGLEVVLELCLPDVDVDPIAIFFFSLVLGFLYCRTRNLSYCILLHAALNGISLILVLLT
jgi:hypothetical protein